MAADSKTEKATPKKRRDERKKGNVFLSNEVTVILGLLGMFVLLRMYFPVLLQVIAWYAKEMFAASSLLTDFTAGGLGNMAYRFFINVLKAGLPLLLTAMALPVIAVGIQTRFLFTAKNFTPKFNRLSPLEGIKKIISLRNMVELIKNILKTIILILILYTVLKKDFLEIVKTMDMDLALSSAFMLNMVFDMIMTIVLVFTVIAGFDFLYQKWDYERRIKMSKQEVKEEFKETEGNPEIKGRIKTLQRQMAQRRMMQAVPQADVIIRNPTHFAVALQYDAEKHAAPVVIAKGQDELALRIVATGEEHGVTVVENRPLARALYAQCELNRPIPVEFYGAVAEVLVYVFKMNQKWSNNGQ